MRLFGFEFKKIDHVEIHWLPIMMKKHQKLKQDHGHLLARVCLLEEQVENTHEILMKFLREIAGTKNAQ